MNTPKPDLEATEIARNILANGGITKDQATHALEITNANVLVLARAYTALLDAPEVLEGRLVAAVRWGAVCTLGLSMKPEAFEEHVAELVRTLPRPTVPNTPVAEEVSEAEFARMVAYATNLLLDPPAQNTDPCRSDYIITRELMRRLTFLRKPVAGE